MEVDSEILDEYPAEVDVTLCIGGTIFTTTRDTLDNFPETRLSKLTPSSPSYDRKCDQYFFDRDPAAFACILNFYRTSELHLPTNLCGNAIRRELEFWEIDECNVAQCCWKLLQDTDKGREVFEILDTKLSPVDLTSWDENTSVWNIRLHRLWLILDKPNSSKIAKIWNSIFMTCIAASAIIYCASTMEGTRVQREPRAGHRIGDRMKLRIETYVDNVKLRMVIKTESHPVISGIDLFLLLIFTLELLLHFVTSPHKCVFFKSFLNCIDILTVCTGWVTFVIERGYDNGVIVLTIEIYWTYLIMKSMYSLRLFRFFRLAERFTDLKVMMLAIRASMSELALLFFTIIILATMFGAFQFYCEFDNNHFNSIPISIWWAVVTMTTVGYGDYYPETYCGRILGTWCALSGLLILAMPIAVIATNYNDFYSRNRCRKDMTRKKSKADRESLGNWIQS